MLPSRGQGREFVLIDSLSCAFDSLWRAVSHTTVAVSHSVVAVVAA